MTTIIIVAIIAAVVYYIYYLSNGNHEETQKQSETPSHPSHFDLLDENGDPLPKQEDEEAKIQMLEHFCLVDHGYHVTVWPKDYNQFEVVQFNIAGMSYRENIDDYLGEFKGTLEAEPDNQYDPNAIKVLAADGHHVGYVPKDMTADVRKYATLPCTCFCYIGENDGTYFSDCYIPIRE